MPKVNSIGVRVLHVVSNDRWSGVAEPVVALACAQKEMGHCVWLACAPGRTLVSEARDRNLPLFEGLHLNRRPNPFHLVSDFFSLARFCREEKIDIVHCHLPHDNWLAALCLRRTRRRNGGVPLVVRTIHNSAAPRTDRFHRRLLLDLTDRFVCISAFAARKTEADLRLPQGAVPHVFGAVDQERFRPGLDPIPLRRELSIPLDAPVAGIVSRMRVGRGFRWLMRAIPKTLDRLPDARFMIVGRGEQQEWFLEEIRKPIYRGRVIYAGYRKQDLPLAYAAMDTSMFLGLGSEGTCRAVLEAMACARPVVGARVGVVPETILDGRTGLLVHDRDTEDLADKLVEMLSDRQRCARMGEAARARVEERFREEGRARAFLAIYEQTFRDKGIARL